MTIDGTKSDPLASVASETSDEATLRSRIERNPDDAPALAKLAEVVGLRGSIDESIALLGRALRAAPGRDADRVTLARLLLQKGDPDAALDQVNGIAGEIRDIFDVRALEAALLGILGRHDEEIALYDRMVQAQPNHAHLWMSYGNALKYAGHSAQAVDALRLAVRLRPDFGEGWWSLANLKSVRFEDDDISTMVREAGRATNPANLLHFHFALGSAFEGRGQFAKSFEHYDAGNRIRASAIPAGLNSVGSLIDEMIGVFDAPLMARVGTVGHPSAEPVFIVGLQRSGSTLIEQILASHPSVEGTSELLAMQQLWLEQYQAARMHGRSLKEHIHTLPDSEFARIGSRYLEFTRPFRPGEKPHFIDKLPANWMQTGFIRLVFPNARIIDARRHPMACGFSNFKQHYASGVTFAYSQDAIGAFYNDYLRLMRHFEAIEPGVVHLAINERIIDGFEAEVRRLLHFVGLPFYPACLEFHRTARAVNTPSAEQVRRPINRSGTDQWRNYEQWLGPLKQALGPAIDDWQDRA